jgi:creatinine amidohydrolase/Fe(II)-dependent formamide hydrolase-like protein
MFPEHLRMDRVVDADDLNDFREHLQMKKRFDFNIYPGNLGYSTLASKEKGEQILSSLLENIDQRMKDILLHATQP